MEHTFSIINDRAWAADASSGAQETLDNLDRRIFRAFGPKLAREIPSEIFKLRYEVYCIEREFVRPNSSIDGMEFDDFDDCSTHFTAYTVDEALIGTVRLVQPPPTKDFPFGRHCTAFPSFVMPPREECGEISRLVVKRTHRRARADSVAGIPGFVAESNDENERRPNSKAVPPDRSSPMVLFGMYREMFRFSRLRGVRFWFAAMERSLARSLTKAGFQFEPIGPVADYYGPVTLYLLNLDVMLERLEKENPVLCEWFKEKPQALRHRRAAGLWHKKLN